MRGQARRTSIIGRLGRTTWTMAVLLLVPALISLLMMFLTTARYSRAMARMERVAGLKPLVGTELPEQLFSVAAGRVAYEDSGVEALLDTVNRELDELLKDTAGTGYLELTVARRTMDTLAGYLDQVRLGRQQGRTVSQIERIVDEVRDVGDLVTDMLDDFISVEIDGTVRTGTNIQRLVWITAAAEALLLAAALLLAGSSSSQLANVIRQAISRLEGSVHQLTGGDLKARVPEMEVEELSELAQQINVMANRLESLIERSRLEQENLAKSELRLLQAQINPHFLYNTLDAIIWQAESGKSEEVIHLTRSLSDFFRISLSSGADWIPVEREVRHLSGYLSIQKTRYRDILDYEIDIPQALTEGYIIKLLLQPLVENALYHGIKSRRGGGMIRVSARQEGERVRFNVEDTGKGMTPEELARVLAAMRGGAPTLADVAPAEGGGFGLRNVDMRIRLYYHQDEGLNISSDSAGTRVSFSVPLRTREEIANDEGISG
ncbi:MAG: histidine kinase [Clostridia bacterium]|nr:histidine kinase [Clostridia bacterium]